MIQPRNTAPEPDVDLPALDREPDDERRRLTTLHTALIAAGLADANTVSVTITIPATGQATVSTTRYTDVQAQETSTSTRPLTHTITFEQPPGREPCTP